MTLYKVILGAIVVAASFCSTMVERLEGKEIKANNNSNKNSR